MRKLFNDPELRITKKDIIQGAALLAGVVVLYYTTCFFLYICGVL